MTPLYAYSLMPVVSIALLLFFSVALRGLGPRGLLAYCGAIALWSGMLLLTYFPATQEFAVRASASGALVAAAFVHVAFDFAGARRRWLIWGAYAVAFTLFGLGLFVPGLLFHPVKLWAGPLFWPGMAMAVFAASVPVWELVRAYREAEPAARPPLRALLVAGLMSYVGAWSNALMLAHGLALPYGLFLVLGSLFVLARVVRSTQPASDRRLMERSLRYSAVAAFLSAGFLFGVLTLIEEPARGLVAQYRIGALFLLFMAALAVEPVRQQLQAFIGRRIVPEGAHAEELARELAAQEVRSHQAERLAELGTFTSAIAHEVRNPLGVLRAQLRLVERLSARDQPVDEVLREMEAQIDRASGFLDDLLDYGRPKPLELRPVNLRATVDLAFSTARQGLGGELEAEFENTVPDAWVLEADQAQLSQVLVILLENALLSVGPDGRICVHARKTADERIELRVEDDGAGVPDAVLDRLFEPFVTSRKRSETKKGTGLGLAIARAIVERHGGALGYAPRSPHGACFRVELPRVQNVLAAATTANTSQTEPPHAEA